jgi:hypothetical protein
MTNYNAVIELAKTLIEQSETYAAKTTKAESARMRKTMNELKKLVTPAKADLMAADKGA